MAARAAADGTPHPGRVLRRLVVALDAVRLQQDWSWREVARDMQRMGINIPSRTLHYLIKAPADARPYDRTLYKLRKYLRMVRARREHAHVSRRSRAARSHPVIA